MGNLAASYRWTGLRLRNYNRSKSTDLRKITDHVRGMCRNIPSRTKQIKKNRKITMCSDRLDIGWNTGISHNRSCPKLSPGTQMSSCIYAFLGNYMNNKFWKRKQKNQHEKLVTTHFNLPLGRSGLMSRTSLQGNTHCECSSVPSSRRRLMQSEIKVNEAVSK